MYNNKIVSAIIPCYNEETQIAKVINSMPEFVDHLIIINDASSDNTLAIIKEKMQANSKIFLIDHKNNQGVGGSIASGYKWARDNNIDIAVRLDGDGQMDPEDLPAILDPVANGDTDYSKGNRLFSGQAYKRIPKIRYFGNAILSLLTKISSGYWHIADSQSGYTAINHKALKLIKWDRMYKDYGQPNDLLVMLNVYNLKVQDVHVDPVYNIGEKSDIKIYKVIFTISFLLWRRFFWRLKEKYIIRDFHPLVFFYFFGFLFFLLTILLMSRLIIIIYYTGIIPKVNALAMMFSFMSSTIFTLFAMFFDKQESNKI
jgi:glycosyltransferase involved in cell wall biosynthesis